MSAVIMWSLIIGFVAVLLGLAAAVDRRARRRGQSPRSGGDLWLDVREHRRDTRAMTGVHVGSIRWRPRRR